MSDLQNTNKKVLKDRLKELRFDFVEQQLEGDISKGILNFASEIRADLIAIIHYKHSFLEKLMQKAVVKAIGYKTEIPLLVLPEMGQSA